MATGTDADVQALQTELKHLRTDFAKLQEALGDLVRHGSAEAIAKARESGEVVWDEAKKHVDSVRHGIESKPITSAATAFGIGVFLGLVFSARRG